METRTILQYELALVSDAIFQIKEHARLESGHGCINPRLPAWSDYVKAKERASLLLTAICVLKHFGSFPLKKDLRKAIRAGIKPLRAHSGKAKDQSAFIFQAWRLMEGVALGKDESYAQKVEAWASKRSAEAAARKKAKAATERLEAAKQDAKPVAVRLEEPSPVEIKTDWKTRLKVARAVRAFCLGEKGGAE